MNRQHGQRIQRNGGDTPSLPVCLAVHDPAQPSEVIRNEKEAPQHG